MARETYGGRRIEDAEPRADDGRPFGAWTKRVTVMDDIGELGALPSLRARTLLAPTVVTTPIAARSVAAVQLAPVAPLPESKPVFQVQTSPARAAAVLELAPPSPPTPAVIAARTVAVVPKAEAPMRPIKDLTPEPAPKPIPKPVLAKAVVNVANRTVAAKLLAPSSASTPMVATQVRNLTAAPTRVASSSVATAAPALNLEPGPDIMDAFTARAGQMAARRSATSAPPLTSERAEMPPEEEKTTNMTLVLGGAAALAVIGLGFALVLKT